MKYLVLGCFLACSSTFAASSTIISDKDAGYDQAAYDACMDSYDESCGDDVPCVDCGKVAERALKAKRVRK